MAMCIRAAKRRKKNSTKQTYHSLWRSSLLFCRNSFADQERPKTQYQNIHIYLFRIQLAAWTFFGYPTRIQHGPTLSHMCCYNYYTWKFPTVWSRNLEDEHEQGSSDSVPGKKGIFDVIPGNKDIPDFWYNTTSLSTESAWIPSTWLHPALRWTYFALRKNECLLQKCRPKAAGKQKRY